MTISAPPPHELAGTLRSLAKILDEHGDRALELAPLLAARGWPASTMGNGSRGNSELTSVEAAVDRPNLDWDDVDLRLYAKANLVYNEACALRTLTINIVAHAGTAEQNRKTGGDCFACDRVVAGTHLDRLRGGYCNACRMAWERAGRPDRVLFQRQRRKDLLERGA